MTAGTKTGIVYCCHFIGPQSLEPTPPWKWLLVKVFLDLSGIDDSETVWILSHIAGSRGANTQNKQTDRGDCLPTTDPPHPLFLHLPHQIHHQPLRSVCRGQAPTVWKYGNLLHFFDCYNITKQKTWDRVKQRRVFQNLHIWRRYQSFFLFCVLLQSIKLLVIAASQIWNI